uniref:Uncharacterized protein n=1 Tax=Sphaerodactylus townsendi TaxID=933632 RepID=A0ACB8G9Y2_9SAUR
MKKERNPFLGEHIEKRRRRLACAARNRGYRRKVKERYLELGKQRNREKKCEKRTRKPELESRSSPKRPGGRAGEMPGVRRVGGVAWLGDLTGRLIFVSRLQVGGAAMTLVLPLSSFCEPIVSSEGAAEYPPLWESRCCSKSSPASDAAVATGSCSSSNQGQALQAPGDGRAAAGQPPEPGRFESHLRTNLRDMETAHNIFLKKAVNKDD